MFKLLKQENPQILTIVVTTASDSELVIELINEAQIFRFLNKPVNVRAALQVATKQTPDRASASQASRRARSSRARATHFEGIKALRVSPLQCPGPIRVQPARQPVLARSKIAVQPASALPGSGCQS